MADRQVLGEGRFLRLVREDGWEYIERTNCRLAVVIVAVTDDGHVLLIEQLRPPAGGMVIEFPAGLVGDKHGDAEDIVEAARRELEEETGYTAERFEILAEGPPSPGLSSELVVLLKATGLDRIGDGGGVAEESESIVTHRVRITEVREWLEAKRASGVQVDPKVFAGLYFA